jgi:hypothetical protein
MGLVFPLLRAVAFSIAISPIFPPLSRLPFPVVWCSFIAVQDQALFDGGHSHNRSALSLLHSLEREARAVFARTRVSFSGSRQTAGRTVCLDRDQPEGSDTNFLTTSIGQSFAFPLNLKRMFSIRSPAPCALGRA